MTDAGEAELSNAEVRRRASRGAVSAFGRHAVVRLLALGRPVMLNDLPGISRLIRNGENGRIVAADDMDGVAQQIAELVVQPATLAGLRAGAEASDVEPWAEKRMGVAIEAVYRDILLRKGHA